MQISRGEELLEPPLVVPHAIKSIRIKQKADEVYCALRPSNLILGIPLKATKIIAAKRMYPNIDTENPVLIKIQRVNRQAITLVAKPILLGLLMNSLMNELSEHTV